MIKSVHVYLRLNVFHTRITSFSRKSCMLATIRCIPYLFVHFNPPPTRDHAEIHLEVPIVRPSCRVLHNTDKSPAPCPVLLSSVHPPKSHVTWSSPHRLFPNFVGLSDCTYVDHQYVFGWDRRFNDQAKKTLRVNQHSKPDFIANTLLQGVT